MKDNWKPIATAPRIRGTDKTMATKILVTRAPASSKSNPPFHVVRWARVNGSSFGWKHANGDRLTYEPTHWQELFSPDG